MMKVFDKKFSGFYMSIMALSGIVVFLLPVAVGFTFLFIHGAGQSAGISPVLLSTLGLWCLAFVIMNGADYCHRRSVGQVRKNGRWITGV